MKNNELKIAHGIKLLTIPLLFLLLLNVQVSANYKEIESPWDENEGTTYDCIYFGSYPQAEVVASQSDINRVDSTARNKGDFIVDDTLYNKLKYVATWRNNEAVLDNVRYRRMVASDATGKGVPPADHGKRICYKWSDETSYHYFKYQPIKWLVLKREDNKLTLLSELALDDQKYNEVCSRDFTWETTTLRSFLNSYNGGYNECNIGYTQSGFLSNAFTSEECKHILDTYVDNESLGLYNTPGGDNTTDKVFTLGFLEVERSDRLIYYPKASTYAKAMGCVTSPSFMYNDEIDLKGCCDWWNRTLKGGSRTGWGCAEECDYEFLGVRPAITLDITNITPVYAGTMNFVTGAGTGKPYCPHKYEVKTKIAGTCVKEEVLKYTCTICGDSYEKKGSKKTANHIGGKEIRNAKNVSEGKDGYSGDTYCKGCGAKLRSGNVIFAKKKSKQIITYTKVKKLKQSNLKKKKVKIKIKAKTSGDGKLTYKVMKYPKGMKKYISVSKKGVVTMKKNAKKGTYKIKITAAGTSKYFSAEKVVSIKVGK